MRAPPLTPLAAATLHVPAPERVLVVGCGDGDAALFLAREFPAARIRGLDPSPARIRAAAGRIGLHPEGRIAFKVGKASALPYPDGFFDLAVLVDGRPDSGEIARVLSPNGHLILARTRGRGVLARPRERLCRHRLARRGIRPLRAERAGDGNFLVARLAGAGESGSGD